MHFCSYFLFLRLTVYNMLLLFRSRIYICMSTKSQIHKVLYDHAVYGNCLRQKYKPSGGTILIDDVSMTLYNLYLPRAPPPANKVMEVSQLRKVWLNILYQRFCQAGVTIQVLCRDVQSKVPIQKHREQKKRDDRHSPSPPPPPSSVVDEEEGSGGDDESGDILEVIRKQEEKKAAKASSKNNNKSNGRPRAVPYLPTARMTEQGIVEDPVNAPTVINPIVDLNRYYATPRGDIKNDMWVLLLKWTKEFDRWPPQCKIIFDCEEECPLLISKGRTYQLKGLAHPFGEADLMIPFYLRYFRDYPNIVVISADSDMIAIILSYLRQVDGDHKYKSLVLRRKLAKGIFDYNMLELYNRMGAERVKRFLMLSILAGNDFIEKSKVTNGIGADWIFGYSLESCVKDTISEKDCDRDFSNALKNTPCVWYPLLCDSTWLRTRATKLSALQQHELKEYDITLPTTTVTISTTEPCDYVEEAQEWLTRIIEAMFTKYNNGKKSKKKPPIICRYMADMWLWNLIYWSPRYLSIICNASKDLKSF